MSGTPDPEHAPPSYSERYAGTEWGRPLAPTAQPEPVAEPRRRFGCLRLLVALVGLFWFVQAIVDLIGYIQVGAAGEIEGIVLNEVLRTLILIGVLSNVFWAAFGLKLVVAPGRRTLGCSALLGLVNAVLFGAALGLVLQSGQGTVLLDAILAVPLVIYVLVMMISLLGRDAWD